MMSGRIKDGSNSSSPAKDAPRPDLYRSRTLSNLRRSNSEVGSWSTKRRAKNKVSPCNELGKPRSSSQSNLFAQKEAAAKYGLNLRVEELQAKQVETSEQRLGLLSTDVEQLKADMREVLTLLRASADSVSELPAP